MKKKPKLTVGWREWVSIPELGIKKIKVKVDTGARTSSLHAVHLKKTGRTKPMIEFECNPHQDGGRLIKCKLPLVDERRVKSSNGHSSLRPVVKTIIKLGDKEWPIEITLIDRDIMGFRMLLGRQALKNSFLVSPGESFLIGKYNKKTK